MSLLDHLAALGLSIVFLYSGLDKIRHWQDGIVEVTELRLPYPKIFAAMTITVQLLGGVSVATGLCGASGAALLALFTIMATVLGHKFWLQHGTTARREFTTALEHVAIVAGLVLIAEKYRFF